MSPKSKPSLLANSGIKRLSFVLSPTSVFSRYALCVGMHTFISVAISSRCAKTPFIYSSFRRVVTSVSSANITPFSLWDITQNFALFPQNMYACSGSF